MKVLHVTQNYSPSMGGTQHTIKKVSEYLHSVHGDRVEVFTTNSMHGPNKRLYKKNFSQKGNHKWHKCEEIFFLAVA